MNLDNNSPRNNLLQNLLNDSITRLSKPDQTGLLSVDESVPKWSHGDNHFRFVFSMTFTSFVSKESQYGAFFAFATRMLTQCDFWMVR